MSEDLNLTSREALEDLRAADRMLRALTPEIEQVANQVNETDRSRYTPSAQRYFLEAQQLAARALSRLNRPAPAPPIALSEAPDEQRDNLYKALKLHRLVRHTFWEVYHEDEGLKAQLEPLYRGEDTAMLDSRQELVVRPRDFSRELKWIVVGSIMLSIAIIIMKLTIG